MALITSTATGNFNAGATWTGGVVPTVGDEARASNGHTVTITANATCDEVSNDGTGVFTINDGVTLTANVVAKSTTASRNCVQFNAASPAQAFIVGNVSSTVAVNTIPVHNTSTGTLNITGNVTAGSAVSGRGALNGSTGTLNITGNVIGGGASSSTGAQNPSTGTINITGNVTAGSVGEGAINQAAGTINITGDATGGSASSAIGVINSSVGTISIVGKAVAASAANAHGASNGSTGLITATRAVGNAYGIGAAGGTGLAYGINTANIGGDSRVEELEYGANGAAPTFGAVKVVSGLNNKCLVTLTTSAVKTLADPSDGTGQANEADVRSGTSYALGNKTGTCAVPAAGSVALGVAVDNTFGTAVLTPAAVWDALTSGMTTSGSIGARLKNAATLDSTGQQLADALSPVP
jgi:hypothetical protein